MEKPMQEKVAFLGAGNIAKAIMGGMLKKAYPPRACLPQIQAKIRSQHSLLG